MPNADTDNRVSLVIACEGPGITVAHPGRLGPIRSRHGALLTHVRADAEYWRAAFSDDVRTWVLINPTRAEVEDCIEEAHDLLASLRGTPGWRGGSFRLAFSGHGMPNGDLVLKDEDWPIEELLSPVARHADPTRPRHLQLLLDCCYSGRALAKSLTHEAHGRAYILRDGFAASMHDENAYELDDLKHGALTFSMRHPGNSHVDPAKLIAAVEEQDWAYLRAAFQGHTPNPCSFLSEGRQHSLDATNGHRLDLKGMGGIEIAGRAASEHLLEALEELREARDPARHIEL